jgi:hypothetical protein
MGIFLARERAFLQNMANLIQAHAEGVKQDVRRVREQPARAAAPAEQPRPAEVAAPEAEPIAEPEAEPVAEAEPSLAEEPAPDEEEGPSVGESRQEIVDLTQESEPIGHDAEEGVLSTVPEGTSSARDAAEGSAGNPGPAARPGVEDDDAREDRSIRELFWGEG